MQEWQTLFSTGKVSDEAPRHLQEAAEFIAFENLEEEERQMDINFDEHEAIRHAELEGALEQGVEQGEENKAIQVALNLLKMGVAVSQVSKATGLSIPALKKLN